MEEAIYKYLIQNETIQDLVTNYSEVPAVFNREAPDSMDSNWNNPQYPRIIFELSMQEDPERKTSGVLLIDYYFNTDSGFFIEEVEPLIRDEIDGYFFSTDSETLAAIWQRTDPFTEPESGNRINGMTITFDVVSFPKQWTTSPCPVEAVDKFLKSLFPSYVIIGTDEPEGSWKATDAKPALYTRLNSIGAGTFNSNFAVTWYLASCIVHVISPSPYVRNSVLKKIIEEIQKKVRIKMPDNSYMFVQRCSLTATADQLKTGQLVIDGNYGLLTEFPDVQTLDNAHIKMEANDG